MDNPKNDSNSLPISVEDICLLANSFVEQVQYQKAIKLYESACKLYPENLALKINLGRVRTLQLDSLESPKDILRPAETLNGMPSLEQLLTQADSILSSGDFQKVIGILELAKTSYPTSFLPFKKLGKIHLIQQNYTLAHVEFNHARQRNFFDIEILEGLAVSAENIGEWDLAAECWIDCLIISGGAATTSSPYIDKIKHVMSKYPKLTPQKRNRWIKERSKFLKAQAGQLTHNKTESPLPSSPSAATVPAEKSAESVTPVSPAKITIPRVDPNHPLLTKMKQFLIFRNMEETDLQMLVPFISEIGIKEGDYIYHENEPVYGLYFIDKGKVEIRKETNHGNIIYSAFDKGHFFGDDCLLNGRKRFTSAFALYETDLFFMEKTALAKLFASDKRLAIHFLWYFWKSLSFQIRESNSRMSSFFSSSPSDSAKKIIRTNEAINGAVQKTSVEVDKKMEVLHAKGLTSKDLGYIARLSTEEVYNAGETIFHEGDPGDRLYIVLEGTVVISKRIPGVGDEALSVLKKGDFFGEMALAGQHVRSADARAQDHRTVLLVITRQALREILSIDTDSAYQFLLILCRILSQRLFEMNEKIYQWRLMSASFSDHEHVQQM